MNEPRLWGLALATYGVGDLVTTGLGLKLPEVNESHPVSEAIIDSAGMGGMVGTKMLVLTGFAAGYSIAPEEFRVGIPLGLSLIGSVIVLNNGAVIASAMSG